MEIKENISLTNYTSFHIGGTVRYLLTADSPESVVRAVHFAQEKQLPLFVIGEGSNLLISDEHQNACFLHMKNNTITQDTLTPGEIVVTADAGVLWDDLVAHTVVNGLSGLECLSGIPGSVGAAPVQNIGAYGQECKDAFISLTAYDRDTHSWVTLSKEDVNFSYRNSLFKHFPDRYIITDVSFRLTKSRPPQPTYQSLVAYLQTNHIHHPTVQDLREAILFLRKTKLPDPTVIGSAGSFFKNPVVTNKVFQRVQRTFPDVPSIKLSTDAIKLFAGWLIEKAGLKGVREGGAQVYEQNSLVITNATGQATASDVKKLAERITKQVNDQFGITLLPEVEYVRYL